MMGRSRKYTTKRTGKTTYSIIVDGKTEVWYFQMMKAFEKMPRLDVKPELPKHSALQDQFNMVKHNATMYDYVFWLIDMDVIIQDDQLAKFTKYFNKVKKMRNVTLFANTPCLEYWFLLHFEETSKYYHTCHDATKELRKYLSDYEKSEKYYKNRKANLYARLKRYQSDAMFYAEKLGDFDLKNIESAKAGIYSVIERLIGGRRGV